VLSRGNHVSPVSPLLRQSLVQRRLLPRESAVSRGIRNGDANRGGLRLSAARRGGRAVECGGLENRYPSLGGSRVQIPPPPLDRARSRASRGSRLAATDRSRCT